MHGQAFVSFHNVDVALKALRETNGLKLHEKPICVVIVRCLGECLTTFSC